MFEITTAGESHGPALIVIIEGVPYGLKIDKNYIDRELSKRQFGYGRGNRMKIENDKAKILSGVRGRKTISSPICILLENKDSKNWKDVMGEDISLDNIEKITKPRPGHADLAGILKYGSNDARDILERASARETAARVAGGAIAKILLNEFGIQVYGYVKQIGKAAVKNEFSINSLNKIEKSPLRCPDSVIEKKMIKEIDRARDNGDSIGGLFVIKATGMPPGLGSHVSFNRKLDGRIAGAIMSIPAIKAVAFGEGFNFADSYGSEVHDQIYYEKKKGFYHKTNHAGGIEGGISNGQEIFVEAIMKPIPTLSKPLDTVDIITKKSAKAHHERSDICAVPSAEVVGEAMLAVVLADEMLIKFASDSIDWMKESYKNYLKSLK